MIKVLLGICLAIGYIMYSDDIKRSFIDSGLRDTIVTYLQSL